MDRTTSTKYMQEFISECKEHKCAQCVCAQILLELGKMDALWCTTQDCHPCDYFNRGMRNTLMVTDESGNTRVTIEGYRTVDNGAGYWVIDCPHFIASPFVKGE